MPVSVFGGTQFHVGFHVGSNVGSTWGPRGVHVGSKSVPRGPRRVHVELNPSTPVPRSQHASSKPSSKLATRQFQAHFQARNTPFPIPVPSSQHTISKPNSKLATPQSQAQFQACNTPVPSPVPTVQTPGKAYPAVRLRILYLFIYKFRGWPPRGGPHSFKSDVFHANHRFFQKNTSLFIESSIFDETH